MTVLVVQSRLSSTRLPKKALLPLGGKPILAWVFDTMKRVKADRYFLATDYDSAEELFPVAKECGFECFAGPRDDVLKRFCLLITETNADTVIRVTGDNPFLFTEAANQTAVRFASLKADYFTYTGLPHGSGVEIFNAKSLLKAETLTDLPYDREHVGPSLYNHTDRFTAVFEKAPSEWFYPDVRTTVDTATDYRRAVFMARFIKSAAPCAEIVRYAQNAQKPILLVPSVTKGHGTGHLRRCVNLATTVFADIFIPPSADLPGLDELLSPIESVRIVHEMPQKGEYALIVSDRFCLTEEEAKAFSCRAPFVCIDEGSLFTDYCDYVLDIIPSCQYRRESNVQKSGFIPLPKKRRAAPPESLSKAIVALGGEDPANLTGNLARALAENGFAVTAVTSRADEEEYVRGVKFTSRIENLREKLYSYDLVVTHYGFTAFEAVAAGTAVLLVATSALHYTLSKHFGFEVLSLEEINADGIRAKTANVKKLVQFSPEMLSLKETDGSEDLGDFLRELSDATKTPCPVCAGYTGGVRSETCGEPKTADTENQAAAATTANAAACAVHGTTDDTPDTVVARYSDRTIRKCKKCGMLYLSLVRAPKETYGESYFFDAYKNQYGKTYLEDFASIKAQGVRRSSILDEIFWKKARRSRKRSVFPSVLDIGCAYGPFLAAAADSGWEVYGTDISEKAVSYVRDTLKFPAVCSAFPDFESESAFGVKTFDAVTMWFVIEHFQNVGAVLRRVNALLPVGGVFAFSTPSASGVSARFNEETFFAQSPSDHFTLWQPETCSTVLSRFGFKVVKIQSTGLHPERFPFFKKHGVKQSGAVFKFLSLYSKLCGLGDTFEVYCVKVASL